MGSSGTANSTVQTELWRGAAAASQRRPKSRIVMEMPRLSNNLPV